MIVRRAVLIAPALASLFAIGGRGFGQEFPTGPITFVVSFPPGGSIDAVMRALAPKLQERLGKPVVIENPILPDLPTFAQLGISGLEISLWYGIVGPAGLPNAVVQRLNAELGKIMMMSDIHKNFANQGAIPGGGTPEQYATFMREESARWADVVKKNDIKLQ